MSQSSSRRLPTLGLFLIASLPLTAGALRSACAQQQEPAVLSGIQYLKGQASRQQVGEAAMVALALLKADVPVDDPALAACLSKIRSRFTGSGYSPERSGGFDVYEAGAIALAVANLKTEERGSMLDTVAAYLRSKQKPNGSWDYDPRPFGDTSISQYAVLGLWECENSGVDVPPSVWDRAAQWYMSVQSPAGSWNYHRDQAEPETVSMTAAGVGSLLICRRQLANYREFQKGANAYMTPVETSGPSTDYHVVTTPAKLDAAINAGMRWISGNFNTANPAIFGKSIFYGLYGIERIGALADQQTIGRLDWFNKGRAYITSTQTGNGAWRFPPYTDEMSTVWAMLFLTKSTTKTLKRIEIRKLGAGTLLGGRYLPEDLSTMTVAGGRVISRPMSGAVEGMLDLLEDPRIQNADKAVAGMIERYHQHGPSALRPHKDRLRKMLGNRDPGVRQVAAWALGRTGDLDVVPDLIGALLDSDAKAAASALQGLQLISRKIDGPAAAAPANVEARRAAAAQWKAWYELVRPLDPSGGLDDEPAAAGPRGPSS